MIFLIFLKQNNPLYKCNFMHNLIYKTDKSRAVLLEIQTFPSCQRKANLGRCWVLRYTEWKHQAKVTHCNPIYHVENVIHNLKQSHYFSGWFFLMVRFYFILFFLRFLNCYSITVVPIFPTLPSYAQPTPCSHSQFPHFCPCPWVMHTCALASPFPFLSFYY